VTTQPASESTSASRPYTVDWNRVDDDVDNDRMITDVCLETCLGGGAEGSWLINSIERPDVEQFE
jgi:hypothetical protein